MDQYQDFHKQMLVNEYRRLAPEVASWIVNEMWDQHVSRGTV